MCTQTTGIELYICSYQAVNEIENKLLLTSLSDCTVKKFIFKAHNREVGFSRIASKLSLCLGWQAAKFLLSLKNKWRGVLWIQSHWRHISTKCLQLERLMMARAGSTLSAAAGPDSTMRPPPRHTSAGWGCWCQRCDPVGSGGSMCLVVLPLYSSLWSCMVAISYFVCSIEIFNFCGAAGDTGDFIW